MSRPSNHLMDGIKKFLMSPTSPDKELKYYLDNLNRYVWAMTGLVPIRSGLSKEQSNFIAWRLAN